MKVNQKDRKQQEQLKRFDQEFSSCTGQIKWLYPGAFSLFALVLVTVSFAMNQKQIFFIYQMLLAYLISVFVLMPYEWGNETFAPRQQRDKIYDVLRHLPISKKNYIHTRMGYLFCYFIKLTVIAVGIQSIFTIAGRTISVLDFLYVILCFFVSPVLFGWIHLRISLHESHR